jgi:putative PIG3 family NAD(P)H quinone oxidoreductase
MKAFVISRPTGPDGLELREVPEPPMGPSDIAVAVRASALNRADLLQMRGQYPAPIGVPTDVPGLEYAGQVLAAGAYAQRFKPGDRVMGLVGGGAFAEKVVVHEREALPIPEQMTFEQAAAIPEAFITAWDALVLQGALRSGEAVLIHAATSGVGTAAVQIVSALGARVLATGRSRAKLERLTRELGGFATFLVESEPRFSDEVKRAAGGGIDLALDLVGGAYLPETLKALAPRGRLILVGLLAGSEAQVDLRLLLTRRAQLVGTVLRSRPPEEKIAVARAAERHLLPLFQASRLRAVIDEVMPMEDIRRAAARVLANETFGKVVLRW